MKYGGGGRYVPLFSPSDVTAFHRIIFLILPVQGPPLDVGFARLKMIPALKKLTPKNCLFSITYDVLPQILPVEVVSRTTSSERCCCLTHVASVDVETDMFLPNNGDLICSEPD